MIKLYVIIVSVIRANYYLEEELMSDFQNKGIYLGHSGFLLELESATLIFDWYQGEIPPLRGEKPVYIFASNINQDHFRPEIFGAVEQLPHAEIFLGYDHSISEVDTFLEGLPEKVQDRVSCFDGEARLYSENGEMLVSSIPATELGVGFIVEIEGKTIFHAGTLYLNQIADEDEYNKWYQKTTIEHPDLNVADYENYLAHCEDEFIKYTEKISGKTFDYAMLPLEPKFGDIGERTIKRYMEVATYKSWSPIQLHGMYEVVDEFVTNYPEYAKNMIGVTTKSGVKQAIKSGEKFTIK